MGWAFALGAPTAQGTLRTSCADFHVDEELDFVASGAGEHELLRVEKTNLTTPEVAARLAAAARVSVKHIGFCGLKDRRAVTRQWFSVPVPVGETMDWTCIDGGARVLTHSKHRSKLKRGVHRGNRFRIVVRNVVDPAGQLAARLEWIEHHGLPNYFGAQRFGRGHRNLELARRLFSGGRLRRQQRSMALSAARSFLFNAVLSSRVSDGTWNCLLPGDVAGLDGTRSIFPVETVDATLCRRTEHLDLHPTGPLWGSGDPLVRGPVRERERAIGAAEPELLEGLIARTRMARRPLRARVRNFSWTRESDTLILSFALDRGQFATALLRELIVADDLEAIGP